jgi:sugar O-acyltransferase (sialic acid O-acetyltransferase NeuD family)
MSGIIILGAAGLAKEFYFYIKRARPEITEYIFVNDLDDGQDSIKIGKNIFHVVKDWEFNHKYPFIVAVGNPKIKKKLVETALSYGLKPADTIVDPEAIILDDTNSLGKGGIISPGCIVTTNVILGDFVTLNLNTTVGHDTKIGDYCTTNPGVHVSGNIEIGVCNEFGTGCVIKDGLFISDNKTIGAQAAVVKPLLEPRDEIFVGVPAKKLR